MCSGNVLFNKEHNNKMVRWRHFHSSSESLSKYRKEIHRNVARKFCYRMVEFILMKFNSRQSWSICTSRVSDHSPGCSMLLVLSSHPVTFSTKCFCEYPISSLFLTQKYVTVENTMIQSLLHIRLYFTHPLFVFRLSPFSDNGR